MTGGLSIDEWRTVLLNRPDHILYLEGMRV